MNKSTAINSTGETGLQFWVQTANHNIVCLQGFSYFSALFRWTNGIPDHRVTRLNFTSAPYDPVGWKERVSSAVYLSLMDIIKQDLTVNSRTGFLLESESKIRLTGLRGCDEIANNSWIDLTKNRQGGGPQQVANIIASFPSGPWLCRNKTLVAAFEDLSNNITMSLLGLDSGYVVSLSSNMDGTQLNTIVELRRTRP
jgi:hypothetical protein